MAALIADSPPREDPPHRPPSRRRGGPAPAGRLTRWSVAIVALAFAAMAVSAAFTAFNPFGSETKDRSHPVLLKSLQDLADYHAASANMEVVVDVEQDDKLLPSFIKGERVLFVAAVTVTLPRAHLGDARLDPARTKVYDRDRGLLDRVGDVFSDNPADEQPLYQLAEKKLLDAARTEAALTATAERNTRTMLEGMLRGLGFERVTVRFATPL
jgi:hypothetical protein